MALANKEVLNAPLQGKGDDIENLSEWELKERKRDEELIKFLDELVHSEEFEALLSKKRRKAPIRKKIDETTSIGSDFERYQLEMRFPLTTATQKMHAFERNFENYIKRKKNKEVLKKQEVAIQTIRVPTCLFDFVSIKVN